MKIVVVGGGVVGLTTALLLKNNPGYSDITVVADRYEDIVSYVAPGVFRIGDDLPAPSDEIKQSWAKDSYEYYNEIRKNQMSSEAGIAEIPCYMFSNLTPVKYHWMKPLLPKCRNVTADEFDLVNGHWKYGCYLETLIIQCSYYLPWAQNKLQQADVQLKKKKLISLNELADDYDVIFNCTGLGAKKLIKDQHVVPIRGQIAKIRAPWINSCFFGEFDTHIIPGVDGYCTLGGIRDFNSLKTEVCEHTHRSIRERCEGLLPSIKNAPTLRQEVGIRPSREGGVRIEVEKITNGRHSAVVVHNYGHSGSGVAIAPGTSKHAIKLAEDFHKFPKAEF